MIEIQIDGMQVPAESPMFARCRVEHVRGWLRWLSVDDLPYRELRMRRLMPEGVPVIVLYHGCVLRESLFLLDEGRLQSWVVATARVMGYMEAIERGSFRDAMLRQPLRMSVHNPLQIGLDLC